MNFTTNANWYCVFARMENTYRNATLLIIMVITVGIDFTARDIQDDCKAKGFALGKGQELSIIPAAVEQNSWTLRLAWTSKTSIFASEDGDWFKILAAWFSVSTVLSHISNFFLNIGDLIFTNYTCWCGWMCGWRWTQGLPGRGKSRTKMEIK